MSCGRTTPEWTPCSTAAIGNVRILPSALNANSQVTTNTIVVTASVEFKDLHEQHACSGRTRRFSVTDVYQVTSATIPNDPEHTVQAGRHRARAPVQAIRPRGGAAVFEAF